MALRGIRIIRVAHVVEQSELQIRARWCAAVRVRLPLLFQRSLELRAGKRGGPQVVQERQYRVGLGVGDIAVGIERAVVIGAGLAEFGTQTAGVDHTDFGRAAVLAFERIEQRIGHQIAHGRFGGAVVTLAVFECGGDIRRHPADLLAALFIGHLKGLVHDVLHLGDSRIRGGEQAIVVFGVIVVVRIIFVGGLRSHLHGRVAGLVVRHRTGGRVVGEHHLADVGGIATGLDDRPVVVRGIGVRVLHVGVCSEDHVHCCIGIVHDLLEHGAVGLLLVKRGLGRGVIFIGGCTLMVFGHNQVGLAIGFVAVGELLGHTVHGLHRIAEFDVLDTTGSNQCARFLSDRADDADLHAVHLLNAVLGQSRGCGALLVHVGTEVIPLGIARALLADHTIGKVGIALVELVVAHRRSLDAQGIEYIDGRLVLLYRRVEQRGTNIVAGGQQQ